MGGLLGIVTGRLNDRFGPRLVLATCGFFLGLGYLLMSWISAVWQLYLFYGVIVAVGMSGFTVPMLSTVTRWFTTRRGLMTGITTAGPAVGIAVVPPLASWLISLYGWRTSYIIIGAVTLVLIILLAQLLRRAPGQMGLLPYGENETEQKTTGLEVTGFSLRQVISLKQFWVLCLISFGNFFNINVVMVHIVIHATDLGITPTIAATLLSVTAAISIMGRIMMGVVADRIGNRLTLVIGFGLVVIAFLWLLAAEELWALYLFAVLFGVGGWTLAPVMSPMVAELFGIRSHGAIYGVTNFVSNIGGALGAILAGYIFDVMNSYNLAFLICAIIGVTGIILTILIRPTSIGGGK